jgi:transcriptional regulator with XRE-family HTH domain
MVEKTGIIKKGRKPHEPTEDIREGVKVMKASGLTDEQIAGVLGIATDTLTKYYKRELEIGLAEIISNVAGSLYRKALAGDVTAAIFILKTRAKWSERQVVEIEEGRPASGIVVLPAQLSMEEWIARHAQDPQGAIEEVRAFNTEYVKGEADGN